MKNTAEHKPYVGDVGAPVEGAADTARVSFGMIVFALVVGFVVGLAVWAIFKAATFLTELVWVDGRAGLVGLLAGVGVPAWWLPIAICALGGLLIGLWTWKMGGAPESLEAVMGTVKKTGGYKLERPSASVVGFLLPLVFGGSIGPEAGLTGIIAAACTRVGAALKGAGLRVKSVADITVSAALSAVFAAPFAGIVATAQDSMPELDPQDYEFRRKAKLVLYAASAFGAMLGIMVFTSAFGSGAGMPRFEGVTPGANKLWWALPCLAAGYVGALLFNASTVGFAAFSKRVGDHAVAKPLVAGLILGILAVPLPYVLFPGEEQAFDLMQCWASIGGVVLIATGFAKCIATPLCLEFGWRGGHFFPVIFAGIALGYGIAALGGFDPMFCVAITTASLVAGVQRKALISLALLLLCFPVDSIVWVGIACLVGAALPMPAKLVGAKSE